MTKKVSSQRASKLFKRNTITDNPNYEYAYYHVNSLSNIKLEYIFKQTKLITLVIESKCLEKFLGWAKNGKIGEIKNLIVLDADEDEKSCKELAKLGLNIYTWEDADLDELAKFIHLALKDTVLGNYDYYKFSRIYYDSKGTLLRDKIGNVVINNKSSKLNDNIKKTLKEIGFQIGDYFDINITSVNKRTI